MNLVLSIVALVLGPLLYRVCQRSVATRSGLDGLLFITIVGIVVAHIVPDSIRVAGPLALVFVLLGIAFAFAVERSSTDTNSRRYAWVVVVGAIALAMHAAVDGLALLPGEHVHDLRNHDDSDLAHQLEALLSNHLALGVVLHRIAVGAAIWWTLRPQLGSLVAGGALFIIAAATSVAYLMGPPIIALMHTNGVALFQAFVAGTLLHVIVLVNIRQSNTVAASEQRSQVIGERLGIVAGLILVLLVPHAH